MTVDLQKLHHLLLIIDSGGFSGAASTLGLVPSALSRHIKELEEQFGQTLLRRTGRGALPTEFTLSFLPRIRDLVRDSERLCDDMLAARGDVIGRVRLGVLQSIGPFILTPLVREITARFPRLELSIREGLAHHIEEWLAAGIVDLSVNYTRSSANLENQDVLMSSELYLVGAAADMLRVTGTCSLQDVSRLPLIIAAVPNRWREVIENAFSDRNLRLNVALELDSLLTVKDLVQSTGIYSILPLHLVHKEVQAGLLGAAKIVDPVITRNVALSFSARHPASQGSTTVAEILRRQVREQVASGRIAGASHAGDDVDRSMTVM